MDIIYFELNNWACGVDYPDADPFVDWMSDDLNQKFRDERWIKANKLVVVESLVDMAMNFCIAAPKAWVEQNCPELLTKYSQYIRKNEDVPEGRFGCPFLEYKEENIGYHFAYEENDGSWKFME